MADDLESTSKPVVEGGGTALPVVDKHRYTLDRELGRGAQSIVCLAIDAAVGREVAFKMVREAGGNAAFVREARITGQLEHPGIVPVYEIGHDDRGQMYCTQKLVRGKSLRAALDACAGETDRLALLPHLIDVCNAVAYAHSRGVVHRDLKPDNVMVGEFGETVVLDWGIAKVLGSVDARAVPRPLDGLAPQHTMQGSVMGTPLYLSPEQAAGDVDAIDRRSDVWSLGVMLYELVAGKLPFEAESLQTLLEKVKAGKYLALPEALPGVSPELAAIVAHALQVRRADRFQDAAAMARELSAFRAGGRLSVYAYSSWELLKRFVARNKALTAVTAGAVVAIAAAAVVARQGYARAETNFAQSQERLAGQLLSRAEAARARLDWSGALAHFRAAQRASPSEEAAWGVRVMAPLDAPRSEVARLDVGRVFFVGPAGKRRRFAVVSTGKITVAEPGSPKWREFPASTRELLPAAMDAMGDRMVHPMLPARLIDLTSGAERPLEGTPDATFSAISPDGARVAVFNAQGQLRLHDGQTGRFLFELADRPAGGAGALAFSEDGSLLAASNEAGGVAVWDLAKAERTHVFPTQPFPFALLFDGNDRLIVGDQRRFIQVFALRTQDPPTLLSEHARGVVTLARSRDGTYFASGDFDGTVVVWNARTLRPLTRLVAGDEVHGLAFAPDGKSIDALTLKGQWLTWDLAGLPRSFGNATAMTEGQINFVRGIAFSPDAGSLYATQLGAGTWAVDLATGAQAQWPSRGLALALAPGGDALVVGTMAGNLHVLDPRTLAPGATIDAGAQVRDAAFTADGAVWIAAGTQVQRWDLAAGVQTRTVVTDDRVFSVAVTADGQRLAWSGVGNTIVLYDLPADRRLASLAMPLEPVQSVAFSNDGTALAIGASDGTVVIADATTGRERCRGQHGSAVFDTAFDPTGTLLASGSLASEVRLWDLRCRPLATLPSITAEVMRLAWSPDGRRLAVGDSFGVVTLIDVAPPEPAERP